jgi:hypothetical protein
MEGSNPKRISLSKHDIRKGLTPAERKVVWFNIATSHDGMSSTTGSSKEAKKSKIEKAGSSPSLLREVGKSREVARSRAESYDVDNSVQEDIDKDGGTSTTYNTMLTNIFKFRSPHTTVSMKANPSSASLSSLNQGSAPSVIN